VKEPLRELKKHWRTLCRSRKRVITAKGRSMEWAKTMGGCQTSAKGERPRQKITEIDRGKELPISKGTPLLPGKEERKVQFRDSSPHCQKKRQRRGRTLNSRKRLQRTKRKRP